MGILVLYGFNVALAGLAIGVIASWFINVFATTVTVIPGKVGVTIACIFGLILNGMLISSAVTNSGSVRVLIAMLMGTTGGMLIPVAIGNIMRLRFLEKMAAGPGKRSLKWGRFLCGCFLLLVTLQGAATEGDFSPDASPAEMLKEAIATVLAWGFFAGIGLWMIRSGTEVRAMAIPIWPTDE